MPAPNVKPFTTKRITGMYYSTDKIHIPEGKVVQIENMRPNPTFRWSQREGQSLVCSTELIASTRVTGMGHHVTGSGATDYVTLAACGGQLWRITSAGVKSSVYTGLSATKLAKISQIGKVSLICDQTSGILIYEEGKTPYFAGLSSPKIYKVIDVLDLVTGWTAVNCTIVEDTTRKVYDEAAIKITVTAGAAATITKSYTSMNLTGASIYADGSSSGLDDYISITIIRENPAEITSLDLILGDSTLTNYFIAHISAMPDWVNNTDNYAAIDFKIRKRSFEKVGTPDWGAITKVRIAIQAVATKTPVILVDYLRLEKTGPRAFEYYKEISPVDPSTTWVASVALAWNWTYYIEGNVSMDIAGNQTIYQDFSPALDLTSFGDGAASPTIDVIEVWLGKDIAGITPTVELRLYTDTGTPKYWYTTFTPTTVAGLSSFSLSKASFSNVGAPADWSAIIRVAFVVTNNTAHHVYADAISLTRFRNIKTIEPFEPASAWTAVTTTGLVQSWDTSSYYVKGDEGSANSLKLALTKDATNGGVFTISHAVTLDLSIFGAGLSVQGTDEIGLWMTCNDYRTIKSITLQLGPVGMAADYYYRTFSADELAGRATPQLPPNQYGTYDTYVIWHDYVIYTGTFSIWFDLHDQQNHWTAVGAPNWNTIAEARVVVTLADTSSSTKVWLDSFLLERRKALSGIYNYKVLYVSINGERSDASNISDDLLVNGRSVMLVDLPIPGASSPNIMAREIYRIGGASGEWKLLARIDNIVTTTYVDETQEEDLGPIEEAEIEGQPYIAKTFCIHNDVIVIGNLTGPDGVSYPAGIMQSKKGSYEIYDHSTFQEIEGHYSGTSIRWMISAFGLVFIGKDDCVWSYDPANPDQPPVLLTRLYGGINPSAIAMGQNEFYFMDGSMRIVSYNNSYFTEVGDDVLEYQRTYLSAQSFEDIAFAYFEDTLLVSYPIYILCCYKPFGAERAWWGLSGWGVSSLLSFKTLSANLLYIGTYAYGWIIKCFDASISTDIKLSTGGTTPFSSLIDFPRRDFGIPEQKKDYAKIFFGISVLGDSTDFSVTFGSDKDAGTSITYTCVATQVLYEVTPPSFGGPKTYLGLTIAQGATLGIPWTFNFLTEVVRFWEPTY